MDIVLAETADSRSIPDPRTEREQPGMGGRVVDCARLESVFTAR